MSGLLQTLSLRLLLPLFLLGAAVLRPSFLSLVYGVLFLICPLVPGLLTAGRGITRWFLHITLLLCSLTLLTQISFQVALAVQAPYGHQIPDCSAANNLLRQFGLEKAFLLDVPVGVKIRVLLPELLAFFACSVTYVLCILLSPRPSAQDHDGTVPSSGPGEVEVIGASCGPGREDRQNGPSETFIEEPSLMDRFILCTARFSELLEIILLLVAATVFPAVLSAVYFITYLTVMTWWAVHRKIPQSCLNNMRMFLMLYCSLHMILLYLYQIPFLFDTVPSSSFSARLVGLTELATANCSDTSSLHLVRTQVWTIYVNPIALVLFYCYMALMAKHLSKRFLTINEKWNKKNVAQASAAIKARLFTADDNSSIHEELLSNSEDDGTVSDVGQSSSSKIKQTSDAKEVVRRRSPSKATKGRFTRLMSIGTMPIDLRENRIISSMIYFLIKQSYVLSLMAMMAWAITYHSWLSFVFLALAGLIWILPNTQRACYALSPFILFYAEVLLCIQFIYGMNLTQEELPDEKPELLKQIGLIKAFSDPAFIPLIVRCFYSLPLFLTLRLFLRSQTEIANENSRLSGSNYDSIRKNSSFEFVGLNYEYCKFVLTKYWIYLCVLIVLVVSIRNPVTAYNVIYMLFFVILIAVLQISYQCWRLMLFVYWTVLLGFSILVLLIVYTFQFHGIPDWWYNTTGQNADFFESLGLHKYDTNNSALLFWKLITPISYIVVVIVQLKFFHGTFMKLTFIQKTQTPLESASSRPVTLAGGGMSLSQKKCWLDLNKKWRKLVDLMFLFAELHISKLIALIFLLTAVNEVSAVNIPIMIVAVILLACRCCYRFTVVFGCIWAAAVVLAKMLFQMPFAKDYSVKTCTDIVNGTERATNYTGAQWAGFTKASDIAHYLRWYIGIFVVIGFESIVMLRQRYERRRRNQHQQAAPVLFEDVSRQEADEGIVPCLEFLVSYTIYKFGLELSYTMTIITICVRMDGVAALYGVLLLLLVFLPRMMVARVWPLYMLILTILLPLQYASCVGLPRVLCVDYPWADPYLDSHLLSWLYMPSYKIEPNPELLVADFFQLLFVCAQFYAFGIETNQGQSPDYKGGSNSEEVTVEFTSSGISKGAQNPVSDFITYNKSYLDWFKDFVFEYMHWITLIVIFSAGVSAVSLFALGYLLACFLFLWRGNDIFTQPRRNVIRMWRGLLAYNIIVILLKVFLQLLACAYIDLLPQSLCFVVQLFSIFCVRGGTQNSCGNDDISPDEARITVDALVFAFLILQLRILRTNYFQHVVKEFWAQKQLASCGAQLINHIIQEEIEKQKKDEARIQTDIHEKMQWIEQARIKAAKEAGVSSREPQNYYEGRYCGDYFMFEYEDQDLKDVDLRGESIVPEVDPSVIAASGKDDDPFKIVATLVRDIDVVQDAEQLDKDKTAQSSLPVDSRDVNVEVAGPSSAPEPESSEEVEEEKGASWPAKIKSSLIWLWRFIASFFNMLAKHFNKWSQSSRYVAFLLEEEKRKLKQQFDESTKSSVTVTLDGSQNQEPALQVTDSPIDSVCLKLKRGKSKRAPKFQLDKLSADVEAFNAQHGSFVQFLKATYYLLVSKTELLCYCLIVLNMLNNASVLALPLPLLAFFWGTLCAPRPSKTFWITLITYAEAVVVIKYLFQFKFLPWNSSESQGQDGPFYAPKIIGIKKDYIAWDIALLMMLFYHRYILRTLGLWKDADHSRSRSPSASENVEEERKNTGENSDSNSFELQVLQPAEKVTSEEERQRLDTNCSERTLSRSSSVSVEKYGFCAYFSCFAQFWSSLIYPRWYKMDLYALTFFCDFICFLILIFAYSSFGTAGGPQSDVLNIIQENRVPLPFVLMLLVQFILIVIDRALYLRHSQLGKVIYHMFLVVLIHVWIFFLLPMITERPFQSNRAAKLWYIVKCIYFILSAWQIRSGYPSLIGNFLTKSYGLINYILFKIFMIVPFLFELRTLMDWIWTDTALTLFDFFKVEDIYSYIFMTKCMRNFEKDYPVPIGQKRNYIAKYGMGLSILLLIILIIWLPLLLFSMLNAIGTRSLPASFTATLEIEGYPPLFQGTAQQSFLKPMTPQEYSVLRDRFRYKKAGLTVFDDFAPDDIQIVKLRGNSNRLWDISEPALLELQKYLNSSQEAVLRFSWEFTRSASGNQEKSFIGGKREPIKLTSGSEIRKQFVDALSSSEKSVTIRHLYPLFLHVPPIGEASELKALEYALLGNDSYEISYANVTLTRHSGNESQQWWELRVLDLWPTEEKDLNTLTIYAFVDKVFPSALDKVTSGGIIGVYVLVVLAAARFIRSLVAGSVSSIIILELPNVDNILQLCQYLFLVREAKNFTLEVLLYAKLLFLYRSPKTLIEWTRLKYD